MFVWMEVALLVSPTMSVYSNIVHTVFCTCVGEGARLDLELCPPLPPLEAELSLDSIDTVSEKAESLSGLSVRITGTCRQTHFKIG